MSFEGYAQVICREGHRYDHDVYADDTACPICGSRPAWSNVVDCTNGDSYGLIHEAEFDQFLISPENTDHCPTCRQVTSVTAARYRIPSEEEERSLREDRYVYDEADTP